MLKNFSFQNTHFFGNVERRKSQKKSAQCVDNENACGKLGVFADHFDDNKSNKCSCGSADAGKKEIKQNQFGRGGRLGNPL